ncbi:MAG: nucleotidyltransferase family protein [Mesorhizobium sp.]
MGELLGFRPATDQNLPAPDLLIELLRINKLSVQILSLLKDRHPKLTAIYDNHRLRTVALNSQCLRSGIRAQNALKARNLNFLLFKGPPQQLQLYDDCYARPCADLDMLVQPSDFIAARMALQEIGYEVEQKSNSLWWIRFLGEQHLSHNSGSIIDLHHRLHQPGSPGPRNVASFLQRGRALQIGEYDYVVPPLEDVMLICCINLAKSLFNRQACGGYVLDIACAMQKLGTGGRAACLDRARQLGMKGMFLLGMRAVSATIDRSLASDGADEFLSSVDDFDLARYAAHPFPARYAVDWPPRNAVGNLYGTRRPLFHGVELGVCV